MKKNILIVIYGEYGTTLQSTYGSQADHLKDLVEKKGFDAEIINLLPSAEIPKMISSKSDVIIFIASGAIEKVGKIGAGKPMFFLPKDIRYGEALEEFVEKIMGKIMTLAA